MPLRGVLWQSKKGMGTFLPIEIPAAPCPGIHDQVGPGEQDMEPVYALGCVAYPMINGTRVTLAVI